MASQDEVDLLSVIGVKMISYQLQKIETLLPRYNRLACAVVTVKTVFTRHEARLAEILPSHKRVLLRWRNFHRS